MRNSVIINVSIMARYSSDSDSDRSPKHQKKHYGRSRSNSSELSDSSSHRKRSSKHSKLKRQHRSHSKSRDRASRSYKSLRSSSRDKDKRRYYSQRSSSYSSDPKKKARSASKEKCTSSRSSSSQSNVKPTICEKSLNIETKDDFVVESKIEESILQEINSEGFTPKQFISSIQRRPSKSSNIVIDITTDTIKIPATTNTLNVSEGIFHTSIMMDQDARFDKWVKKLYTLRQKAIIELTHINII